MLMGGICPAVDQCASLISRSITNKNVKLGMALHSHLVKTALLFETFLANRLVDMYSKCNSMESAQKAFDDLPLKNTYSWNTIISLHSRTGNFDRARKVFDEMPNPNLVSYNSFISGLTNHGFHGESLNVFREMQKGFDCVFFDEFTLVCISRSCACLGALALLRQVHAAAIVVGLEFNLIVYNALIDAYGKCGEPHEAYSIFSRMQEKDVVSWTSIVVAYARASKMEEAYQFFDRMPVRNVVSWTALITIVSKSGFGNEALDLFQKMQENGIFPSAFTFVAVLGACADLALIERGRSLHGLIVKATSGYYVLNTYVINALVDMYSKCGDMGSAAALFDMVSEKDVVTWNSLITGYAQNGLGKESLLVFKRMIEGESRPNEVTFLGVLSACCHAGLASEGLQILELMAKECHLKPSSDHFAVVIDLLGRSNRLDEALELIQAAPYGEDHVGMWGALLGACRVHGNLGLASRAAEALFELEPSNVGRYVMLQNIYAADQRWGDAEGMRRLIEQRGLKKGAACSWTEVRNAVHKFVARDKSHCQMAQIYELLGMMVDHMKDAGCLPFSNNHFLPDEQDSDY